MKNYSKYAFEKRKEKSYHKEQKSQGFRCAHCRQLVVINEYIGTKHRNHCNYCLWSNHVDLVKPGDRKSYCHAGMQPIGLTFKYEGFDRYGNMRQGEIKIVHRCVHDGRIATNRIAADDDVTMLFKILKNSVLLDNTIKKQLLDLEIYLLRENDRKKIEVALFGR